MLRLGLASLKSLFTSLLLKRDQVTWWSEKLLRMHVRFTVDQLYLVLFYYTF